MSGTVKKNFSFCCALFIGALLRSGIAAAAFADISRFHRPDTAGYLEMAFSLVKNGDFGSLTGRVPLFPLVCSAFMFMFGNCWQGALVAFLVLVSEDASDNTKKLFKDKSSYRNIPYVYFSNKLQLGYAIGKAPRAVLGIKDINLAGAIKKILDGGDVIG